LNIAFRLRREFALASGIAKIIGLSSVIGVQAGWLYRHPADGIDYVRTVERPPVNMVVFMMRLFWRLLGFVHAYLP
jgi:hypothetical protein